MMMLYCIPMYIVDGSNDVVRSARSNRCSISAPNTNAKNSKARRARAKEQDEREPLLDIYIAHDDLGWKERDAMMLLLVRAKPAYYSMAARWSYFTARPCATFCAFLMMAAT